jgi:DNA-binding response OmpR family regulator
MKARVLWIEGTRASAPSFIPQLRKKEITVEIVTTGKQALERLIDFDPDLVVINGPSLRTTGKRICRDLRAKMDHIQIVLILAADQNITGDVSANVVLQHPFTSRKLLNRVLPLLPGDETNMLHVGHVRLDLARRKVRCQGREAHLTPRLTHLLHILMQHPGEVVERKNLFREAWETEYTGDTRTLDVHVSWLRQILEEDPKNPTFVKTIRGVGYRLDA